MNTKRFTIKQLVLELFTMIVLGTLAALILGHAATAENHQL